MSHFRVLILAALVCGLLACGSDEPQVKGDADAGTKTPIANTAIANAVATVQGSAAPLDAGPQPPAQGVFEDFTAAQKAHPKNKPPAVTIAYAGADPKLQPAKPMTWVGVKAFTFTVAQSSRKGTVGLRFDLAATIGAEAAPEPAPDDKPAPEKKTPPKAPKKGAKDKAGDKEGDGDGDGDGEEAKKPEPITKPTPIRFVVTHVEAPLVPAPKLTRLPIDEDDTKKLASLVGAVIEAEIFPDGSLQNESVVVKSDTPDIAKERIRWAVGMLGLYFSPWPSKQIGQTGMWFASDRSNIGGVDVVRYRVTTVEKLAGQEMSIKVDAKMYGSSPKALPDGLPPGTELKAMAHCAHRQQGMCLQHGPGAKGVVQATRKNGVVLPMTGEANLDLAMEFSGAQAMALQVLYYSRWDILQPKTEKKDDEKKDKP